MIKFRRRRPKKRTENKRALKLPFKKKKPHSLHLSIKYLEQFTIFTPSRKLSRLANMSQVISATRPIKRARTSLKSSRKRSKYPFEDAGLSDSTKQGKKVLEWLMKPLSVETFFKTQFEKVSVLLRNEDDKFASLLSMKELQALVRSGKLTYGCELDVTSYKTSCGRETLNLENGTAVGVEAWDHFKSGCSLRLLRPQQHIDGIYRLCAHLESFLECVVGANVYLTPGNSQGFAPHFDDIDAFICQIAGKKRWRVYAPRKDGLDRLPRHSSVDFTQEEVEKAGTVIDTILQAGDVLYLPRGCVHQAECTSGESSLHVTISAFQKWTWADLLLESFEMAVKSASAEDVSLRQTLPMRFGTYAGVGNGEADKKHRERFEGLVEKMVRHVGRKFPTDAAADLMAGRFMRERLPPVAVAKRVRGEEEVRGRSIVRCISGGIARIVVETEGDGMPMLIHCAGNSRTGGGESAKIKCLPEEALAVDVIIKAYPTGVRVEDLPLESAEDRIVLVEGLLDMRIVEIVKGSPRV